MQDSKVEDLFCDASSGLNPACTSENLSHMGFKPVQD